MKEQLSVQLMDICNLISKTKNERVDYIIPWLYQPTQNNAIKICLNKYFSDEQKGCRITVHAH